MTVDLIQMIIMNDSYNICVVECISVIECDCSKFDIIYIYFILQRRQELTDLTKETTTFKEIPKIEYSGNSSLSTSLSVCHIYLSIYHLSFHRFIYPSITYINKQMKKYILGE